jgi:hypothetical protein
MTDNFFRFQDSSSLLLVHLFAIHLLITLLCSVLYGLLEKDFICWFDTFFRVSDYQMTQTQNSTRRSSHQTNFRQALSERHENEMLDLKEKSKRKANIGESCFIVDANPKFCFSFIRKSRFNSSKEDETK